MEEPGMVQSMGPQRVGHDWVTELNWTEEEKWGFPGGSVVKNPPTNAGDASLTLGQEETLEKEMATHSSILAWEIQWTEEPGGM